MNEHFAGLDDYRKRQHRAGRGTSVVDTNAIACPRGNVFNPSCKRRDCPFCGPRWARSWEIVMREALDQYGAQVALVTLTAPGEDLLPWDEDHCAHRRPHRHSGKLGCRVEERFAREWSEMATLCWKQLRDAAATFTRSHAPQPGNLIDRVWEPQRRGVPHLHIVLGYGTLTERIAAQVFVAYLKEKAPQYRFGFVDAHWDAKRCDQSHVDERGLHVHSAAAGCRVKFKPMSGGEAARYLVRYLTGRGKKKSTIRENISHPNMPGSLIWLTPRLTNVAKGGTGMTMRTLRRARHLWAVAKGRCEQWPRWKDVREAAVVGYVCHRAFARRGEADEPPPIGPLLELAEDVQQRFRHLEAVVPVSWAGWLIADQRAELERFANDLALRVSGIHRDEPQLEAMAEAA